MSNLSKLGTSSEKHESGSYIFLEMDWWIFYSRFSSDEAKIQIEADWFYLRCQYGTCGDMEHYDILWRFGTLWYSVEIWNIMIWWGVVEHYDIVWRYVAYGEGRGDFWTLWYGESIWNMMIWWGDLEHYDMVMRYGTLWYGDAIWNIMI